MHRLSAREKKILERLLAGSSNRQMVRDLNITAATVKADMRDILRKRNARKTAIEHSFTPDDRDPLSADQYSARRTILVVDDDAMFAYAPLFENMPKAPRKIRDIHGTRPSPAPPSSGN